MPDPLVIFLGFSLGLFSTLHCLGMCGAIVSALSCSIPRAVAASPLRRNGYIMLYNVGRITTYATLGIIAGLGGGLVSDAFDPGHWHKLAAVAAGLSLVLAGIYLGGWVSAVRQIDLAGRGLWRYIEPVGRRMLPIRSPATALGAGLVWGWLPCGLVYYALLTAAPMADPLAAAVFMTAFGLGTVPGMQATGAISGLLVRATRHPQVRAGAAVVIILIGALAIVVGLTDVAHRFVPLDGASVGPHHGHN